MSFCLRERAVYGGELLSRSASCIPFIVLSIQNMPFISEKSHIGRPFVISSSSYLHKFAVHTFLLALVTCVVDEDISLTAEKVCDGKVAVIMESGDGIVCCSIDGHKPLICTAEPRNNL